VNRFAPELNRLNILRAKKNTHKLGRVQWHSWMLSSYSKKIKKGKARSQTDTIPEHMRGHPRIRNVFYTIKKERVIDDRLDLHKT
jgi:ribosomal protein S30